MCVCVCLYFVCVCPRFSLIIGGFYLDSTGVKVIEAAEQVENQ